MAAVTAPPALLVVDDPRFERHIPLGHHPERPERLRAARDAVRRANAQVTVVEPRAATEVEVGRVHDPDYLQQLAGLRGKIGYLDPDTYVSAESVDVAWLAAGSVVAMVDSMIDGPVHKGIALVRPPGHHAGRGQAMGFCLINNVAVAAAHARARGIDRVAIVDWDVHHGNGTQEIFWRDPSVLYVSTHQAPFYPGTGDTDEVGEGDGEGFTVNVALGAGSGDAIYASAFERIVLPVVEAYAPGLILVSAGFDASARDPLAQMQLTASAFGWMAHHLAQSADKSAQGRIALVLEGGYDLIAIDAGIESALQGVLFGRSVSLPRDAANEEIDRAARAAKSAWPSVRA